MTTQKALTEKSPLLPQVATPPSSNLSSSTKTFGNILISIVGAGVLGLPYTFMQTGWLSGLLVVAVVALIAYYGMMLLVWSKRSLQSQGFQKIESFGDLGFAVYGNIGKALVDFMVVLGMSGVCVGYLILIGNTLSSMFSGSKPLLNPNSNQLSLDPLGMPSKENLTLLGVSRKTGFLWAIFPLELVMSGIRSLTHLAPFSIFADVVNISAMLTVMMEDLLSIAQSMGPHVKTFTGFDSIPYGVGVTIYAFEGVSMILPLELAIEKKHKFGWILGLAIAFIACLYGGFGALGYFAFGSETRDIVTLNLGKNLVTDLVQLALCVNLFFTFPLMMNPVYEVIEGRLTRGEYSLIMRSVMVFLVTLVSILVPSFTDFLSLIGSSIGCILGFILPALFHLHVCWDGSSFVPILADLLLIAFGIVFGIIGSISSVNQILT
eukprot:Gb_37193 [translate_table: standard]